MIVVVLLFSWTSSQVRGNGQCTPSGSDSDTTRVLLDTYNFTTLLPEPWTAINVDGDGVRIIHVPASRHVN